MKNKTVVPLPFYYYLVPVWILALGGLADTIYLSISHYRVYVDIHYSSFCAISRSINCDTVSQSPFSILLGMPVPIWGVIGYIFFIIFLTFASKRTAKPYRGWAILFCIAGAFSFYSVVLAFISSYYIKSYCLMCIVNYAINFSLVFYCWLIRRRFPSVGLYQSLRADLKFFWYQKPRLTSATLISFVLIVLIAWAFFPTYWKDEILPNASTAATGLTSNGHPWIGASDPRLVIEEFSDYHCFQCRKMHFYLRRIIAKYPDRIRLIHRQFPMDDRFNPIVQRVHHRGAGKMALIAIAAAAEGKFWEANDYLFSVAHREEAVSFTAIAEAIGLTPEELAQAVSNPENQKQLMKDLSEGIKLGITGTPAFVIDGELHLGTIPADILERVMD